jgi:hypothetical protein
MIFHWNQNEDNIFVRCDSIEKARELFKSSCSVRSPLRERCLFVLLEDPVILPDELGYIIDRKLGDKCKDIYFFNVDNVQLYLSVGYEPKKAVMKIFDDE